MCMEDIRIGRGSPAQAYDVATSATWAEACPLNQNRVSLILSAGQAQQVLYRFKDKPTTNVGIPLAIGTLPIVLNVKDHGNLVYGPWYVASPGGADTVSVSESTNEGK